MNASTLRPRLVVVTGPIASGKSTLCQLLTDRLLHAGLTVACIDVDDVFAMVHAPGGPTEEHWDQAHRAHGSLVGSWLNEPWTRFSLMGPSTHVRRPTR